MSPWCPYLPGSTVIGQLTLHASVIGQYASFTRAVMGQLHLKGVPIFMPLNRSKTNGTVVIIHHNI